MQLELINTERQPRQHQDILCREILKVRGYDGLFKSCDVCGADIADDLPEVSLPGYFGWACALLPQTAAYVHCMTE
jgi:hypothetical protein